MNIRSVKNFIYYAKDVCEDRIDDLKEGVSTAVDRARLQRRITAQRNELNAMYASLGKDMCDCLYKDGGSLDDGEASALYGRVKAKEEVIDGLERQLRIVAGKVICPACGRFTSERYSYCPYCGRRIGSVPCDDPNDVDVSEEELAIVREIDDIDIS